MNIFESIILEAAERKAAVPEQWEPDREVYRREDERPEACCPIRGTTGRAAGEALARDGVLAGVGQREATLRLAGRTPQHGSQLLTDMVP